MPTPPAVYWTNVYHTVIERPCLDDTHIYLRWLSPRNQWEGWLFRGDRDTKTSLDGATSYTPGDERKVVSLDRPGVDTLTLRAGNLSTQQHAALTTLIDSPAVYIQTPAGRVTRVFVQQNANASRTTGDSRHEFSIDLDLTRRNAISN